LTVDAADAGSDDITPDSAVVVDYDSACLARDVSYDASDAGGAPSACSSDSGRPGGARRTGGGGRFFPVVSSGSLNEVLRQCRSRSGSNKLLDKLRGSTFSLQMGRNNGYSPLGSTRCVQPGDGEHAVRLVDCCTQTEFSSCVTSRSDVMSEVDELGAGECDVMGVGECDVMNSELSRRLLQRHMAGLCADLDDLDRGDLGGGLDRYRLVGGVCEEETGV